MTLEILVLQNLSLAQRGVHFNKLRSLVIMPDGREASLSRCFSDQIESDSSVIQSISMFQLRKRTKFSQTGQPAEQMQVNWSLRTAKKLLKQVPKIKIY